MNERLTELFNGNEFARLSIEARNDLGVHPHQPLPPTAFCVWLVNRVCVLENETKVKRINDCK